MSDVQLLSEQERADSVIHRGGFYSMCRIATQWGDREFIRRNNGTTHASQALALWLPTEYQSRIRSRGELTREAFIDQLILERVVDALAVQFIAVERAITQFPEFGWSRNALVEIPGGVCNIGETDIEGGERELREELKLEPTQVLCSTVLRASSPYDAGGHIESTALIATLFTGDYKIPRKEGTIPELCARVPLLECRGFLEQCVAEKIAIQGFAHSALTEMLFLLLGGINEVQKSSK